MVSKQKILIVDDDNNIAELIALYLTKECFETMIVNDGESALSAVDSFAPNLILLDLMLPGIDGYQVCREVRAKSSIPIIMLSAKGEIFDKVLGLELGADDYVTKPFSPKELVLRVASVLKRCEHTPGSVIAEYGPFTFDKNALKFYIDKEEVDLTATEFKLMIHMVEREGQTLNRNDLLSCVWGYSHQAQSRTLDTHMKRLRQKLAPYADCIETVRSIGYRFTLPGRRIPEEKA